MDGDRGLNARARWLDRASRIGAARRDRSVGSSGSTRRDRANQ